MLLRVSLILQHGSSSDGTFVELDCYEFLVENVVIVLNLITYLLFWEIFINYVVSQKLLWVNVARFLSYKIEN